MIIYLNNCKNRDHKLLFGSDAFYDLGVDGVQATKAMNLKAGQQCIVAQILVDGKIVFSWFSFSHETVMLDNTNTRQRAFFGSFIKSDTLFKKDAAQNKIYSPFFDKKGNFKRQSVIQR